MVTKSDKQLLTSFYVGKLSIKDFLEKCSTDLLKNADFVVAEIEHAIKTKSVERLDAAINLMWWGIERFKNQTDYTDVLNRLLLIPYHHEHQYITKTLQGIKSPLSVPFIRQVLETDFSYLAYTCSESGVIAKWFSHALFDIGTAEAIEVMRDFSQSDDAGVRAEMLYRLGK